MGAVAEILKEGARSLLSVCRRDRQAARLITSQDVAEAILKKSGVTVKRQQLDMQPLRSLAVDTVRIRLTMDLIPEGEGYRVPGSSP